MGVPQKLLSPQSDSVQWKVVRRHWKLRQEVAVGGSGW